MFNPANSENVEEVLPPGVSVVVPVYNSEQTLGPLAERLEPVLRGRGGAFELVLVNDGSRDGSWGVIDGLAAARPWVRGIDLMRNHGQHNALLCGIREARFDTVLTIDDDLQNPPEEIPVLLAKLDEGFDVVYGTPQKEQHGLWRDLASQITKLVLQEGDGGGQRPPRQRVPGVPHVGPRGVRRIPQPLRLAGRAAHLGHAALHRRAGPARRAAGRGVQLHVRQAGPPRAEHGHRLQHRCRCNWPASSASSSPCSASGSWSTWWAAT